MTRFARAAGSKASNARLPADPTPWSEMAPAKATKRQADNLDEVTTPKKKEAKVVKLTSDTPKTPSQLMSPPTSTKKLARKTPLKTKAALDSSIISTPTTDSLQTPTAPTTDPSPLQTRSARKKRAELAAAAAAATPVKTDTPLRIAPARTLNAKSPAPKKTNARKSKAAKEEEEEELCLKLEEDGMDSDDLDSDDDDDNVNCQNNEVDEAAIEKLLSEAKNAKTHLSQVKKMELDSPKPALKAEPKTPTRGVLKPRTPRSKANTTTEVDTPSTEAVKTPKRTKIVEEAVTPGKGAKSTPARKTAKIEPIEPVETPSEVVPEESLKTPAKSAKAANKKNKTPAKEVESTVVEEVKTAGAPVDTPAEEAKTAGAPKEEVTVPDAPAKEIKLTNAPAEEVKSIDTPAEEVKSIDTPAKKVKLTDTPAKKVKSIDTPAKKAKLINTPAKEVKSTDTGLEKRKETISNEDAENVSAPTKKSKNQKKREARAELAKAPVIKSPVKLNLKPAKKLIEADMDVAGAKDRTNEQKWKPVDNISVSRANEERFNKIRENLLQSGKPAEQVETEMKKIRRSMLKRLSTTRCLRCRHRGHMQKDCPSPAARVVVKCYKCGESDHTSKRCSIRDEVYKFAECYICKEVGHLTKTCPNNTNGIYPRGGSCYKCSEKTHLARDCPRVFKESQDENVEPKGKTFLVGMLDDKLSGDADVAYAKPNVAANKGKRKSVVKF